MAITLNGTTGISSPGGDTSTSLATTNLSYTGTLTGGTGVIAIGTNQIYKDASGNVGIGTASPTANLQVQNGTSGTTAVIVGNGAVGVSSNIYINGGNTSAFGPVIWGQAASTNEWIICSLRGAAGAGVGVGGMADYVYGAYPRVFYTNGAERARIDSSGNVGIGTASPLAKLSIGSGTLVDANVPIQMNAAAGSGVAYIGFNNAGGYGLLVGYDNAVGYARIRNISNTSLAFSTNDTERARITSDGNFLVGGTPASAKFSVRADLTSAVNSNRAAILVGTTGADSSYEALAIVKNANDTTNANKFQTFFINAGNTASGYITANGANAAGFSSSSDSRLKENITVLPNQLDNICALKPSEFDYKDGSGHQIGFIAQEMEEVYPDCVAEDGDGMLMISGWSKTEARLVKAIQELTTRLEALEAQ